MLCPVCASPVQPEDRACKTCGAPLTPASSVALTPGQTLAGGQYVISRVLGRGGFGVTYDAQDGRLGLRVAIKELFVDGSQRMGKRVIPPGNLNTAEFQETKKRFLDEAKVLARFNHPGIVRVLNYFEENDTAYLVMEFLEGRTLGGEIEKQGRLAPARVQEVARGVADTLEHIHAQGLLHRDIKPDNIFLTKDGRVVLIDFGSVRAYAPGKTVSHTRLVTPGYAPLEQYGNAAKFGPYTDIYALGATLHHALTGQMPPPATDLMLGTPLPLLPSGTPAALEQAVKKMMALQVKDRPQSAQEVVRLLDTRPAATPAAQPAAPAVQKPPAQQTPAQQPAARSPAAPPRPSSTPTSNPAAPQPQPNPARPPTQTQPNPAPQPAPQPVPTPAPNRTQPAPAPSKPPFTRTLLLLAAIGLGAANGIAQLERFMDPTTLGLVEYGLAALVGAALGYLIGRFAWWALPILLPLAAGAAGYYYADQAALHWPSVTGLTGMAAIAAYFFMKLIRRL